MDWMSMMSAMMNSMGNQGGGQSGGGGGYQAGQEAAAAQDMRGKQLKHTKGLMGGANQTSAFAAPTEAQDMALGMSALEHYKDMSDYANINSLFGQAGQAQSLSGNAQQNQRTPAGQSYVDPYLMGLMRR